MVIAEVNNRYSDANLEVLNNKDDIKQHTNRLMEV